MCAASHIGLKLNRQPASPSVSRRWVKAWVTNATEPDQRPDCHFSRPGQYCPTWYTYVTSPSPSSPSSSSQFFFFSLSRSGLCHSEHCKSCSDVYLKALPFCEHNDIPVMIDYAAGLGIGYIRITSLSGDWLTTCPTFNPAKFSFLCDTVRVGVRRTSHTTP